MVKAILREMIDVLSSFDEKMKFFYVVQWQRS